MNNQNRGVFSVIEHYLDMLLNLLAVYIAYFFTCLVRRPTVFPNSIQTVIWILVAVIVSGFVYQAFSISSVTANAKLSAAIFRIFQANFTLFGVYAVVFALFAGSRTKSFLLIWVLVAFAISSAIMIFKCNLTIRVLKLLRSRQYILRKVIIVGDNTASAKEYVSQISKNPQHGIMIVGYVGNKITEDIGCDKLGVFTELERILDEYKPTDVVFSVDAYDKRHLIRLVNICDDHCVKVYFLPVIYGFFKTPKQLEQVGSLPIINIHKTPLDNIANAAVKRIIDIIGSVILIIATSPLMLVAAIGTRLSSPGPILFKQVRVGRLGKKFTMYKFRSMKVSDRSDTTWTTNTDSRKTKFGNFLRKTAIDELPQLFNVFFGSMSLVGPRPELPKFVDEFRKDIPLYMVKHYVKPGMTGLAQIKGLRGDTSVEDRIHEDIDYIEKWTLWLDIFILLCTPFKAFNKNEKYIDKEIKENPELYGALDPELVEIKEAIAEERSNIAPAGQNAAAEADVISAPSLSEEEMNITADETSESVRAGSTGTAGEGTNAEAECKSAREDAERSAELADEMNVRSDTAESDGRLAEEASQAPYRQPEATDVQAPSVDCENADDGIIFADESSRKSEATESAAAVSDATESEPSSDKEESVI